MTQALALAGFLREAGHRVERVLLGTSPFRSVPDYFASRIDAPVEKSVSEMAAVTGKAGVDAMDIAADTKKLGATEDGDGDGGRRQGRDRRLTVPLDLDARSRKLAAARRMAVAPVAACRSRYSAPRGIASPT